MTIIATPPNTTETEIWIGINIETVIEEKEIENMKAIWSSVTARERVKRKRRLAIG